MNPQILRDQLLIIYQFTKAGLLHHKRNCSFCETPLIFSSRGQSEHFSIEYVWKCPLCFHEIYPTHGSIMRGMNIVGLGRYLELYIHGCRMKMGSRLLGLGATCDYSHIIRVSQALYVSKLVRPFITLPGPVEIDEAKMQKKWVWVHYTGQTVRWMFGMFCRQTQIPILYYLARKKNVDLVPYMKRHILPGTAILTDTHPSYVHMGTAKSRLSQYGYYHFWMNHSAHEYSHAKFPFVQNTGIENVWQAVRHHYHRVGHSMSAKMMQEHLDSYTFKVLFKKRYYIKMILKAMRFFYLHYF